ncbi:Rho-GTPase-activating protein 5 [Choanephora cucurbitarum]|uniref:Rho-GTPase-activating protein 5 n=1 Tax=Choanephora cucurbitarum TaxID=101091 RepID=A0A1C7NSG4_9FUNG|nr:Rho-GTPase-activating protein 5 [Choanephora cucurbitarum]
MRRSNSNPNSSTLSKRRSFRGWLKRVTIPNGNGRRVDPELPKGGVFGIPLSMSIKYAKTTVGYIDDDNVRHTKAGAIPIVVAKCGSFLKKNGLSTEGIFRVPGNVRRVNTLELIFDQSTSNYGLDLSWEGYTVHDAASLLRRYLNKLPDPVIPFEFYREFRDVMNSKTYTANESRIEALQQLIQRMPIPHQHLLLYLLDTLSLFASNASETKMTISNLAAVFCPGILRHPDENTPVQYKISQYVIEFLIEFQSLFTMQLLAKSPHKQPRKFSAFSPNSDIPPVPLLLSSQTHSRAPELGPLRITNPSSNTSTSNTLPVLQQNNNQSSSFIESPIDMNIEQKPNILTRTMKPDSRSPQNSTDSLLTKARISGTPYYRSIVEKAQSLKRVLDPYLAKSTASLACLSILATILCAVCYEIYLALNLYSFEPIFFFVGMASYWNILYKCIPEHHPMASPDLEKMVMIPMQASDEPIEDDIFPNAMMNAADEEEMMKDESIMSEWRDLLTRSWKTSESDTSSGSKASASKADDEASIMSKASRFNEEEDLSPSSASSSSSSDDEDLGFDPETLEMYLSQYDQIKKDAELAKKLQSEEQKARDENNPFVVNSLNISKARNQSKSSLEDDNATTPTDSRKEEWKIRVFNR